MRRPSLWLTLIVLAIVVASAPDTPKQVAPWAFEHQAHVLREIEDEALALQLQAEEYRAEKGIKAFEHQAQALREIQDEILARKLQDDEYRAEKGIQARPREPVGRTLDHSRYGEAHKKLENFFANRPTSASGSHMERGKDQKMMTATTTVGFEHQAQALREVQDEILARKLQDEEYRAEKGIQARPREPVGRTLDHSRYGDAHKKLENFFANRQTSAFGSHMEKGKDQKKLTATTTTVGGHSETLFRQTLKELEKKYDQQVTAYNKRALRWMMDCNRPLEQKDLERCIKLRKEMDQAEKDMETAKSAFYAYKAKRTPPGSEEKGKELLSAKKSKATEPSLGAQQPLQPTKGKYYDPQLENLEQIKMQADERLRRMTRRFDAQKVMQASTETAAAGPMKKDEGPSVRSKVLTPAEPSMDELLEHRDELWEKVEKLKNEYLDLAKTKHRECHGKSSKDPQCVALVEKLKKLKEGVNQARNDYVKFMISHPHLPLKERGEGPPSVRSKVLTPAEPSMDELLEHRDELWEKAEKLKDEHSHLEKTKRRKCRKKRRSDPQCVELAEELKKLKEGVNQATNNYWNFMLNHPQLPLMEKSERASHAEG